MIKPWKFTLKEIIFSSFSPRLTKRNTSSPVTKRPVSWEIGTHGHKTVYRLTEGEVLLSLICKYCIEKKHPWYVTSVQLKTFYTVNKYNSPSSLQLYKILKRRLKRGINVLQNSQKIFLSRK